MFTPEELKIIGICIDGDYSHDEGDDVMIFGSHTFPVHRKTVSKAQCRKILDERYEDIRANAQGE